MSSLNFIVSRATEWPTEIQHLACLLDSPIPSRLANGPYPPVSSRASPLLEELESILECSPEHLTDSSSEVLDILDLLLSTVAALRVLAGGSKDDTRQSTIPFWSLLIRSLSFMCYDKSYIMQDVAFVRPRLSHSSNTMEDGHASLLISHIVEDIWRPRPVVEDDASGHLSIMRAERSNESSSDSDTSYERTEASTDPTSAQSYYVPLDGHILAYWRHPNSVVLPYLCVTDEEDIFSLMSGVVYQRSTWGICKPVIGIILSKTGFVGRVVFGWLDNVCADPDVLPTVRFAYADGTRTDPSLGVYDLTDAVSALKFAQFIIGLRAHVEGIVAQCQAPTFKRLSWRSDTIDDDDSGSEEEQWEQRIVCWRNTVERCDTDHTAPSDTPSTNCCCSSNIADSEKRTTRSSSKARSARHPRRSMSADSKRERPPAEPTPFVPDIDLRYPREPSLGATGSKTPSDRASAQLDERGGQETKTDGGSSNNENTGKRSKSADALSCSALGAKSLAGISPAAKLSFSSYAHDRKIISLSNIPLDTNAHGIVDAADEINEMLEFYEEMTKYMKPPIEQNESPVVDKRIEEVRDHFLVQIDACSGGKNTSQLPRHFWEVISGCFSSLLWASVGGYSKELADKSPNEAEARHEWDILLNLGFVNVHELASGRVVLERALSLSRNVAADVMNTSPTSAAAEFQGVARQSRNISYQHVLQLEDPKFMSSSNSKLVRQAEDFHLVAATQSRAVSALFDNAEAARKAILKRAGDEPELGIVDAILTLPLERLQLIEEPLICITETRETVNAAKTLSEDNISEPDENAVSEMPKVRRSRPVHGSRRTKSATTQSELLSIAEEQEGHIQVPDEEVGRRTDDKQGSNGTRATRKENLLRPFSVTCSVTKLAPKMTFPPGVVMDVKELLTKLLLAVLVAEYKKPTQTYAKAVVQAKMYAEASVRYLASLGVTKQAVFALATDGVEGAVLMAWCSSDSETVYIVERNVQTFNISSPIEVYHFVTVLLRLREYGDTTLKDAVLKALEAEEFQQKSWSKTAQFNRME
ncbi:uncharacterized protein BT62DRAFT_957902 [Guyanagaster necrorhizus]|uniref:Uncharacterized protein n=1 Tax=Guyanagaster necrorhizus TaxID=856835 RepID=A0A9P7VGM1_9AGAR|nr:uncharacterized protein BT62DRAFT_957902 [Guyanagaster necrorhizus MCA 3950]KAG7439619.1 hypothetical protein BT62DRAFT_957902 [Guyanagaster necrorhizus MCA 3950]